MTDSRAPKVAVALVEHAHSQCAEDFARQGAAEDVCADLGRSIAIRLRALRLSLGLSAATMDRHAGFGPGTMGRLERSELRVYASHLYRVCAATGISIGYFYDVVGTPHAHSGADPQDLETQRLLLAYMNIKNPTLKRDVFELIETLASEDPNKAP